MTSTQFIYECRHGLLKFILINRMLKKGDLSDYEHGKFVDAGWAYLAI